MSELSLEEIHLPEDLEALDVHALINSRLVAERSAGSVRIMEDLHDGAELVSQIINAKDPDSEVLTLALDKRQKRVLDISRKMGPMATADH